MSLTQPSRKPIPDRIQRGYKLGRSDLVELAEDRDAHAEAAAQAAYAAAIADVGTGGLPLPVLAEAPAAPATGVVLYVRVQATKTELCARTPDGDVHVLATEA